MTTAVLVGQLSDQELLAEVKVAAGRERVATVRLIALLAQVDERRLYLGEGCSSLFTYCTQVLHLSEHAAYGRVEAARAAWRFPILLELLSAGSLTLTAVTLLAPHLTEDNHADVLESARHKSKRDVEHIVARLRPQPDVPASVRKLPEPASSSGCPSAPVVEANLNGDPLAVLAPAPAPRPGEVTPLAPERYKVQFTVSRETHEKLRRVQNLLRHSIPNGDPAAIFDRAPCWNGSSMVMARPLSRFFACSSGRSTDGSCGSFMETLGQQIVMLEAALQEPAGAAGVTLTVENGAILITPPL